MLKIGRSLFSTLLSKRQSNVRAVTRQDPASTYEAEASNLPTQPTASRKRRVGAKEILWRRIYLIETRTDAPHIEGPPFGTGLPPDSSGGSLIGHVNPSLHMRTCVRDSHATTACARPNVKTQSCGYGR